MKFEKALGLSTYFLLLSGFTALAAARAVTPWLAAVYFFAVLLSWRVQVSLTTRLQTCLFVGFVAFYFLDLAFLTGFVQASVHLLILISLVKMFSRKGSRDYLLIYSTSFTFLLVASTYTMSAVFLISLIVYIFSAILTFTLFESQTAYQENQSAAFFLKSYLEFALATTALTVLISVPIFLVIPRNPLGLFRVGDNQGGNLSGFSDRVQLGEMGRILTNRGVFMRVRVDRSPDQVPVELKWRGIVLDRYDGKAWINTREGYRVIRQDPYRGGFLVARERRMREALLRESMVVEMPSSTLFGADRIIQIAGTGEKGQLLIQDRNGSMVFYPSGRRSRRYTVDSDLIPRREKLSRLTDAAVPNDIRDRYLELPPIDGRIAQMARRQSQGATNGAEKALALEGFLRTRFGYSLDNVSASAVDPLADFLFRTRAGHCEYFATALAVMLRTLGIPSRVVNGFRRGEFNRWGNCFVVRQSDAHSWVEAYFPGAGWVEFDPTPASASTGSFYLTLVAGRFLDAVDIFWTEVVAFDRLKQVVLFTSLKGALDHSVSQFKQSLLDLYHAGLVAWARLREWKGPDLMQVVFFLLLVALVWRMRRYRTALKRLWHGRVLGLDPSQLAPDYYLRLLEILSRKGYPRDPSETPREFLDRVSTRIESPWPARITEAYYRHRFASQPPDSNELLQIHAGLKRLARGTS
ncbi:MAG: DUF3488 and DUF4129 domain-containing transglutaminase family protein [Acidobacteriota bacterium]